MRWLRSHGAPSDDVSVYLSDMRALFHLPTREEYTHRLKKMAQRWSAPFFDYYRTNIHPDIESIARWSIELHGVYDPYSGVTNNQAEGINYVLKELQQWREAPVDCMVLALHYLQGYYRVEIARGQQGLGNYHLHRQFSCIVKAQPSLIPEHNIFAPEKIVARIKGSLDTSLPDLPTINNGIQDQDRSASNHQHTSTSNHQLSQRERAKRVLEGNKINIDPKLHTFTVWGSKQPHVVTLFSRETCSCPFTSQCYHILAPKMCIGQDDQSSGQKKLNFTQLRKNVRTRKEKKSGRKRPRPGDCDVVPAPDAAGNQCFHV